jgi:hypothetical protein
MLLRYFQKKLKLIKLKFFLQRAQLIVCVRTITQQDFPEKWVAIVDKVHHFIQTNEVNSWYGALQAFYQLCKIYEYKSAKDREPYHKAMAILLPMFLERLVQLNEDSSDLSVLTQKQILKIFFTFTQVKVYSLI